MGLIRIFPADKWFSLCIRERSGWTCERCGVQYQPPTQALHCSHFHSRGSWSTRFDPANCLSLCYGCHQYTSVHREEHVKLMKSIIGELEFDRIHYDASRPAYKIKSRKAEIAKHYRKEKSRMDDLRSSGVVGRIDIIPWQN
jgi:hypothetical protein